MPSSGRPWYDVPVPAAAASSDRRLDELYREHPEGFVAARNRLANELRAAGERDEAERIRKLRRPTAAAWLINLAALTEPARTKEFAEASRLLEEVQRRALDGAEDAAQEWRDAAARESEATAALVDVATSAAREAGHPANVRALELVGQTLRAASADPELRERVVRGRVEREQTAATLGTPAGAPPSTRAPADRRRREVVQAGRELERLEAELVEAEERTARLQQGVERAAEVLRNEKSRLAESKREAAALRRQVKAAARRARG
jgi:hypothetical protein